MTIVKAVRLPVLLAACGAGLALAAPGAKAETGCSRGGVAGPWQGDGWVDLVAFPFHVPFHFEDTFTLTDDVLTGDMRFDSFAMLTLPAFVRGAVAERYSVKFTNEDDSIQFQSNWGAGGGWWGDDAYAMTAHDGASIFRVEERGTIADCNNMLVQGDFYQFNILVGHMQANYSRP